MAPKAKVNKGEQKAAQKLKAEKVKQAAADKTFGLKNKNKSKNVQAFVNQMQQSANAAAVRRGVEANPASKEQKKAKKEAEEKAARELNELFAEAIKQPKAPPGVDPKSIVCEYFRVGKCSKGFKCKYSHDLDVERKKAKIDLFSDQRENAEDGENMEDWDQEQLEKVIADKHAKEKTNATAIICKFFLEAVEKKQYGWFWQCPNGKECKYRHALPPGYVLKSQMKELLEAERAAQPSVEEQIEEERAAVDAKTPITEETFKQWFEKKAGAIRAKEREVEEARRKRGALTGREIFAEEGFVAEDDLSAAADYTRENDDEQAFAEARRKADEANAAAQQRGGQGGASAPVDAGAAADAAERRAEAAGSRSSAAAAAAQLSAQDAAELFDDDSDDEDEDLEGLEEQLRGAAVT
mmetsp:Transcript_675/g.1960  ORF Transcript_675/g.1960 Transcript_675/m.1960 type:complete len:411 (-) Transcript_675:102-1334(-)|eukprot:CAMPEP_0206140832 /NCGR_PEP_ID=MMETSP1473-20131121/10787_1 /ASSEMBLY_ACC=CAM_ASM_001109 /TAXON_ID=1461547 /ORGANISM="Stichococcus sp, Strain RCC1054" /LENGTH=410 /DNA_ID=CAMNT_0053535147 /DNA_START=213 /DNA_END=1445 /DNA_ORIENTATION=-